MNTILEAYLEAALWASIDDDGESLSAAFSISDLAQESIEQSQADIDAFIAKAGPLLEGLDHAQIGHDLWLTRNHHGAGFWDRGLGHIGDELTAIAHTLGEVNLYVGDDGLIYC